jgi:hypothetical protein
MPYLAMALSYMFQWTSVIWISDVHINLLSLRTNLDG